MSATEAAAKVRKVCARCGSEDVRRDAWAAWDVETQTYVLAEWFDYAYCIQCDGETGIREVPA